MGPTGSLPFSAVLYKGLSPAFQVSAGSQKSAVCQEVNITYPSMRLLSLLRKKKGYIWVGETGKEGKQLFL